MPLVRLVDYPQSKTCKKLVSTLVNTTRDGQYVGLTDRKTGPKWALTKALLK